MYEDTSDDSVEITLVAKYPEMEKLIIDTRIPLDVMIPVTKDAALQIFEDNGKAFGRSENDYELQYAIKYMETSAN